LLLTFVFELQHFDPSVNQNLRAPVDMKLRTQKDGCLQIELLSQSVRRVSNTRQNNKKSKTYTLFGSIRA
jgi:hypothetical protein